MKILVLSFYYYPDLCAGSFRAEAFIKALIEKVPKDCEIHLITTMPNRYKSFKKEALAYEKIGNLIIHRIDLPMHESGMLDQTKAFLCFAIRALSLTRKEKYSLVFATSSRLMTAFLGSIIARKNGARLYLDIRDIFVDTLQNILPKSKAFFFTPLFSWIEKKTINQADKVNLVSGGFAHYFQSRFPLKDFSFFTNGIDQEFIDANFQQSNPSSLQTILYAGNIGEGQGLHNIIPKLALRLKGRMRFRIIGDGGRKITLVKALEEIPELDNVEVVAPVNREELIREYQEADILFMHLNNYPAFEKVLPSKLFEYGATGKPILAGIAGYSAEFCKREMGNVAIFFPCDVEQAVNSLRKLSMNMTDRKYFIKKYNRDNIMDELVQDFLGLL